MSSKYDPIDLSFDAVKFAKSRFGVHYLSRLKRIRESHLEAAQDINYTDSYRANRASKAAAVGQEIEFFQIAQTIQKSPNLLAKLKKKLIGGEPDEDV